MSLYQYEAIGAKGKKLYGDISADSLEMAKELLKKKRLYITSLKAKKNYEKKIKLSSEQIIGFTGELAQLLKAGLPLHDSLKTIEEKHNSHKLHPLFLDLCDLVGQGRSLSYALGKYPKVFDPIFISMVASGEETATLPFIFEQLTQSLNKQNKLKKQISSAMIYPAFLGFFCFIVVVGLFVFLIPSMKELLEDRPLHPLTQNVLRLSDLLSTYPYQIVLGLVATICSIIIFFKSSQGKKIWERLILRAPLIGPLVVQSILVRFCRTFAVLLSSGLPALEALELAKKVMHHQKFESIIDKVREKMIEGKKISEEMAKYRLIPPLMVRMIATGEESGKLDKMLQSISELYQEQLEKSLSQLMNLLQPVMILLLGLIVGFVLLSVLLPLTDVSSFLN